MLYDFAFSDNLNATPQKSINDINRINKLMYKKCLFIIFLFNNLIFKCFYKLTLEL